MASASYAPIGGEGSQDQQDALSPASTPRLGEMDLGRMSFFEQQQAQSRAATPTFSGSRADSPGYGNVFSSAQSYAPLNVDHGRPPTPGTPGTSETMLRSPSSRPWIGSSAQSDRASHRLSIASSHMLAASDYGSQHHLMRYTDSGAIPLQEYEKDPGAGSRATTPGAQYMPVHDESRGEKYGRQGRTPMSTRKKWILFGAVVVGLIIVAIAVAIPLVIVHDRQHGSGATVPGTGPHGDVLTSGRDGSVIRMDNGTTFVYVNSFGGEWRSGLSDDGARAQNYTPALNEPWDYAKDTILGVNLGGWLVLEPFIVPSLFEPYENDSSKYVVDEFTLMKQWETEGGQAVKEQRLREHYNTFITEYDFMMIAAAGLNWVRLPIAYWAIASMDGEPFVEGMAWEYLLKAVQWARKYGLRINLDLHAVPGSQNGYNHGGRLGVFNFLNSPSGMVSAQRALDTIRVITEFIAQPEISNVVPLFGILNEPNLPVGIGMDNLRRFYIEAYSIVRNITGFGQGKGPFISYHDGFMGFSSWTNFMQGADRVAWDLHPYVAFGPGFQDRQALLASACNNFGGNTDTGLTQFGVTFAGEWSLATNDCGLYLNGPFQGVRFDGSWTGGTTKTGDCGPFDDWQNYSNSTKTVMYQGALAQMSSFHNFFFWTWKVGDSLRTGKPVNPNWSYLLGLQQGWMPKDPHNEMQNACANLQKQNNPSITKTALTWSSTFADYQTGAASTYSPSTAQYSWPPPLITVSGQASSTIAVSALPTYTPTGSVIIPPTPTYSLTLANEAQPSLNPWTQGGRQTPANVPVRGCNYFDSIWNNATTAQPGWPCQGSGKRGFPEFMEFDGIFEQDQNLPLLRALVKPMFTAAPQR